MCLIICAHHLQPEWPLVVAANRDEYYSRPTQSAAFWAPEPDRPRLLAGRDLTQGGTWLGITGNGRFAAVTNVRTADPKPGRRSRGFLASEYLLGSEAPADFALRMQAQQQEYAGFNLLVGDRERLFYLTNATGELRELGPGLYGLSNGLLDADWPKINRGKRALAALLASPEPATTDALIDMMRDTEIAPDDKLPDTGMPFELERVLSSSFIYNPQRDYGTRCSTGILVDSRGVLKFCEQNYAADTRVTSRQLFEFTLTDGQTSLRA